MIALLLASAMYADTWKPVKISFYSGGNPRTSDGTPMRNDGMWCATYLAKKGTVLEVRVGDKTLTLPVRDRTAKRFGHRIDVPRETWRKFGQPLSRGLLRGEWRVKK